jgi:hypothetical protein
VPQADAVLENCCRARRVAGGIKTECNAGAEPLFRYEGESYMKGMNAALIAEQHNPIRVSRTRLAVRALGVTFLSLLSLAAGLFLFIYTSQIQDLFFDVRPEWWQGVLYWAFFYIIAVLFWVAPLVFTSRLLLQQNAALIGVDTPERYYWTVMFIPKLYVVIAFLTVFGGIIAATDNLPIAGENETEGLLRSYLENHLIILASMTALLSIVFFYKNFIKNEYYKFMERFEQRRPQTFARILYLFEKYAQKRDPALIGPAPYMSALKPAYMSEDSFVAAQRGKVAMCLYLLGLTVITIILLAVHFILYSDAFAASLKSMQRMTAPDWLQGLSDSLYLSRAAFIPVVLGVWLPFLAFLAFLSNRYQVPLIAGLLTLSVLTTFLTGDGHDVRVLETSSAKSSTPAAALPLERAVALWKKHSGWDELGCEQLQNVADRTACPRPVIVAGEGGGSRAAFFTASTLGLLEDLSLDADGRRFSQQLFAISSVSGSAVGSAFFVASLLHAGEDGKIPVSYKDAIHKQRLWYRNIVKNDKTVLTTHVTYKDALQAALANDYLSPIVIAYLARDLTTFARLPFVMDRAGVIETAWEKGFDSIFSLEIPALRETDSGVLASLLDRPFSDYQPDEKRWLPLLVLNATSTETGRRILATPLTNSVIPGLDGIPERYLFSDSYNLYELFCRADVPGTPQVGDADSISSVLPSMFSPLANVECEGGRPKGVDVRLSTAAGLSARFPFISPHGNIRDGRSQIVDSGVDGGYFDSSGAVTALEIASALKVIDNKLEPYVLQISNAPEWFPDRCPADEGKAVQPVLQDESDFRLLGTLGNILTVSGARDARSYQTITEVSRRADALNPGRPAGQSHTLIYVCPQAKENFLSNRIFGREPKNAGTTEWKNISLSWWLSPPLQAYLDGQLHCRHNQEKLDDVLLSLGASQRRVLGAPCLTGAEQRAKMLAQ